MIALLVRPFLPSPGHAALVRQHLACLARPALVFVAAVLLGLGAAHAQDGPGLAAGGLSDLSWPAAAVIVAGLLRQWRPEIRVTIEQPPKK